MPADGQKLLILAHAVAEVAHVGQCRKGDGEPYIQHVRRVAGSCGPLWRTQVVAWLHDTIEDTRVSRPVLDVLFPEDIVDDVWKLTKTSGSTYAAYIAGICEDGSDHVLRVKFADLNDNLRDVEDFAPGLERRYLRAKLAIQEEMDTRVAEAERRAT